MVGLIDVVVVDVVAATVLRLAPIAGIQAEQLPSVIRRVDDDVDVTALHLL